MSDLKDVTKRFESKLKAHVETLGPVTIKPGGTAWFSVELPFHFRGEKILPTHDVEGLVIASLHVGQVSQLPKDAAPIPVSDMIPSPLDSGTRLDTCYPGLAITMSVANRSESDKTFGASLYGKRA